MQIPARGFVKRYLGNHREHRGTQRTGAGFFFIMQMQETGAGTCSDASFLFDAHGFLFHYKDIFQRAGEKHTPVQKKRRPVCHQRVNVRKKVPGLYLHSRLSRAQGASGFSLMSLHAEEVGAGILAGW